MSVQFAELIIIGSAGAYVYDQEVFARWTRVSFLSYASCRIFGSTSPVSRFERFTMDLRYRKTC